VAGAYVAMADGSVRFISDYIEKGTDWNWPNLPTMNMGTFLTWQRLNASADAQALDPSKF
jgi:hypothetical protein